ncbi:MAG: putative bifunctional diguanylate cyclase/phosphodiesterase [Vicinamibacterales bacterium]
MSATDDVLFNGEVWRPALEKYAAVTNLTVVVYGVDHKIACGPIHPTPLFDLFTEYAYDSGIFTECASRSLSGALPAASLSVVPAYGLTVIGTPLVLEGETVGALVAGFALSNFPQRPHIERLAGDSRIPFDKLWEAVRSSQPAPEPRLLLYGELLELLGNSLVRGTHLTHQYREVLSRAQQLTLDAERANRLTDESLLQMSHMASHDPLTGLPNRMLLEERIVRAITVARRYQRQLAVLFLDVDRFKHINDSLGHGVGDRLLQSVAERLTASIRGSDTVSRQGGDEFVVLLSEVANAPAAAASAQKIISKLTSPHVTSGHELHVSVSIGISVFPGDGDDATTLIKCADTAMYQAKALGRDQYQFFTANMNARAVERLALESSLRTALKRQEFLLHYQPKMNLNTGSMIGAEALIRWQHPDRGLVRPTQFVPIAEDSGLIVPVGQWVLFEACRQARAWQDAGLRPVPVSVNISAVEFRSKGFLDGVREILRETRLEPHYLELELTERVLMEPGDTTVAVLRALKDLGVQLSVDDFGTGYSSLSYLRKFPIDSLKLDQSFVHEISNDSEGAPIVTAVISMGKSLNYRVVAEGVETVEQLVFLQAQLCAEGQGYLFSPPLAALELAGFLKAS